MSLNTVDTIIISDVHLGSEVASPKELSNPDVAICGHTHQAEKRSFPEKNITYFKSGCWAVIPSS